MPYLILCIGCILFALSAFGLYSPTIEKLDFFAVEFLAAHRTAIANAVAIGLAYVGGMPFVLFIGTMWCLFYLKSKKYADLIFVSCGILGSIVLGWFLKWCFERPRPLEIYQLVHNYGTSFPSAHSVYAATLASLVILLVQHRRQRLYFIAAACLWLLCMGLSRIYAGVHYPTDVMAGWSIGFIWISLLWLWIQSRLNKNKLFSDKNLKEVKS